MYLIAWEDAQPVGHAHLAWNGTHLGLPEIQDVFVVPEKRRRGIATQLTHAAEEEARARGVGQHQPQRQPGRQRCGTAPLCEARLRRRRRRSRPGVGADHAAGRPFDVDDTLVYLTKQL